MNYREAQSNQMSGNSEQRKLPPAKAGAKMLGHGVLPPSTARSALTFSVSRSLSSVSWRNYGFLEVPSIASRRKPETGSPDIGFLLRARCGNALSSVSTHGGVVFRIIAKTQFFTPMFFNKQL
jgi:hypothetical protein